MDETAPSRITYGVFLLRYHKELPETYDYLNRIEARLGIKIEYLSADRGFDRWLEVYGLLDYYRWRSRSGCFFCFFQRKYEWVRLSEEHPDYFAQAVEYERKTTEDRGYPYTWAQGETLLELIERKEQIIADHERSLLKEQKSSIKRSVLETVFDDQDLEVACHL